MDNGFEINVDFLINNPELKRAAEQAKQTISGVGQTGEQVSAKVQANAEKVLAVQAKRSREMLEMSIKNMQDFAKSTTNETVIANSNRKIQDMQAEVKRLSNIGKAGFDEMGERIVEMSNKTAKGTGALKSLWGGLKTIANILPGVGIAGLLAFAVEPIIEYISKLEIFKGKLTETSAAAKATQEALAGGGEYEKAVANITSLKINLDLAKQGLYSKKAVLEQYNDSIGKVSGQLKDFDDIEQSLNAKAPAFIEMTLKKATAQLLFAESAKKSVEALSKTTNTSLDATDFLNFVFGGNSFTKVITGRVDDAQRLNKEADVLAKSAANIQLKAAELAKSLGGILGNDSSKKVVADKTIEQAESLQRRVYEMQAEFARKSKTKDEEELQALRDRFLKIAQEVEKFNKNPKNKIKVDGSGLLVTRDSAIADLEYKQTTERIKISLEEQRKLYNEYEEYKKTFGESQTKIRYGKDLNIAKEYQQKLIDLEAGFASLESKKNKTGGEEERQKAVKKFLDEAKLAQLKIDDVAFKSALDASQGYFDKLIEIENKYQDNRAALQKNGQLTTVRTKELDEAKKLAIDAAKDEALQKTAIYKKLSVELLDYTKRQIIEQIAAVKNALDGEQDLPKEIRTQLEKDLGDLEIRLKVGVEQSNLDALKERFAQLKRELASVDELGGSIVSEKERRRIVSALTEIQGKIKSIDANGDGKASWGDKVAKQFEFLKGDTAEVANGLSKILGEMSNGFEQVANSVGGVNTGLGQTLIALASVTKLASNISGTIGAFAGGDIIGGVTGVINIVGTIVGGIGAAKKAYDDFYEGIIRAEREYQDALYQRQLLNEKIDKTAIDSAIAQSKLAKDRLEAIKKEAAEIMKTLQDKAYIKDIQHVSGLFGIGGYNVPILDSLRGKSLEDLKKFLAEGRLDESTKKLVERLIELEKQGYDAEQVLRDLAQTIAELFTGTTSDSLVNSLAQMFEEGKTSAQDFADFFEKTMSDAALSIFKNKILAEAMDKFYKDFAKQVADGNLTADEIADLKALFEGLISGANTQFEALKQITGLSTLGTATSSATSGGSITGVIQRTITEQTGSELLGLFRATYDLQKRALMSADTSLTVIREGVLVQQSIATNTANTVKQLELAVVELKGIGRSTYKSGFGYDRGF